MRLPVCLVICAALRAQDASTPPPKKEVVIVTGVYEPVKLDEADRSVNVIPVDVEEKLLSNTLFDLLRLDPELDLQSRGVNGIQTDISIRGGNFGQTLILLDGMRL